jgi:hypothetical protein
MKSRRSVSSRFLWFAAWFAAVSLAGVGQAAQFPWTFTYQGQLMESGVPKNGTADMVFKLFDSASGGSQAGQTITANGVALTDGRFTIELDFTNGGIIPGVFDGYDRYLEITVNGTLLTPREKITAAPHSIFARELSVPCQQRTTAPLALEFVSDSDVGQERIIHSVTNSTKIGAIAIMGEALGGGNNENVGVAGHTLSANGFGVAGTNDSPTGNCTGVYGVSQSNAGAGVSGFASSATGSTKGVYGRAASPDGYAGYFDGRGFFSQAVGIRTVGGPGAMLEIQGYLPSTGLALNVHDRLFVSGSSDFVGVDRTTPVTSAEFFGVHAPVASNTYGGMYINTQAADAFPFYGYATNGLARAWTYYDGGNDTWYAHVGGLNRLTIEGGSGDIGIKRTPLANDFEVEGTASKTTAGSWLANSDARIKTDVRTIDGALQTLDRVRLVDFRYTEEYRESHPSIADRRYMNVIAQEFREVFPDAVKGSGEKLPNGQEILQVDTYPLTIYSAAAVQELHRMLQEKDAEIARQGKELASLGERMAKLESVAQAAAASASQPASFHNASLGQ